MRAETVLVVEDEEALRTLVEHVLGRTGYMVLTAASGSEALRVFEQHQGSVHLLLTDVVQLTCMVRQILDDESPSKAGNLT